MTYKGTMPSLGPVSHLFLPFQKPMWQRVPQPPSPPARMQRWKGYENMLWAEWKTGQRRKHPLWFPAFYTHRGTNTAVDMKVAFGMLKAADVCLSFLALSKALLLSSLLLPCHCSLRLGFCSILVHVNTLPREEKKGSQKVVIAAPCSVDLGLPPISLPPASCFCEGLHAYGYLCFQAKPYKRKLTRKSPDQSLLEENLKQRVM